MSRRCRVGRWAAVVMVCLFASLSFAHCPRGVETLSSVVSVHHVADRGEGSVALESRDTVGDAGKVIHRLVGACPSIDVVLTDGHSSVLRGETPAVIGSVLAVYYTVLIGLRRSSPTYEGSRPSWTGRASPYRLCVIRR